MFESIKKRRKIRQLQFPDGTVHEIKIKEFAYSTKCKKYFISYYDKNQKKESYTILEKENKNYYTSPTNDIEYKKLVRNYRMLKIKDLPLVITCTGKNNKKVENKPKKKTSLFQKENIIKKVKELINNIVSKNKSNKTSNNEKNNTNNKKKETNTKKTTQKTFFDVYEINNNLYIEELLFDKFIIKDKTESNTKSINNKTYIQVTKEEIKTIESTNKSSVIYIPKYKKIKSNKKEEKKALSITLYSINNKLYISEKIYNLFYKNNNINTKIIKEKNYVPITKTELKNMEEQLSELNYKTTFKIKEETLITDTVYRLKKEQIIQDLPFDSKEEQTFNTPGMTNSEIEESKKLIKSI